MVSSRFRTFAENYSMRLARPLARLGLSPSAITLAGAGFGVIAAIMYARGNLIFAFFAVLLASLSDIADGAVAKLTNSQSALGGFLDSVLDRYSDSIILIGIGIYLPEHLLLVLVVLFGTLLVSYTRARAEMEIEKCDIGIGERAERLTIIMAATVLDAAGITNISFLYWALVVLAVLTHFTAIQRIWFTYGALKK